MQAQILPLRGLQRQLVNRWQELADSALEPNPFFEPAMALKAEAWLGSVGEVCLLVVEGSGRRLEFVAPVVRRRSFRRVPVPALVTWRHEHCFLGTPLVSSRNPTDAVGAALDLLRTNRIAPWFVLELVGADGPVSLALTTALAERGMRAWSFQDHDRGALARREQPDYLNGQVNGRHLRTLRRQRRQLAQALGDDVGTVDLAAEGDVGAAVESFLAMEAAGWKGAAGGALGCRPHSANFFRQLCNDFADRGRLQLLALGSPQRTAAYQCNLLAGGRSFNFKITFDEELRRFSPGVLLYVDMMSVFHRDDRLTCIDSCADPANDGVNRLFPDRLPISSLLIPLSGIRGRLAAQATPPAVEAYHRARGAAADARAVFSQARWSGLVHRASIEPPPA